MKKIIGTFIQNRQVVLPEQLNLNLIKNLIDKLELQPYCTWEVYLLILATYLGIINILNIIFAARLVITKGKVARVLFMVTSVLTFNVLNWIEMFVFITNDKKAVL
ncbi:hypothetical protein [Mesoplasma melaleucae]|uniref:hypothetical protein n=1 Tax=Mesoplasma melaleucae TaxID=81459 RepID=UPI0004811A10|nr:hypothetical protein [Mesoplasma melaleucae]